MCIRKWAIGKEIFQLIIDMAEQTAFENATSRPAYHYGVNAVAIKLVNNVFTFILNSIIMDVDMYINI